jgi:hypothetical protein
VDEKSGEHEDPEHLEPVAADAHEQKASGEAAPVAIDVAKLTEKVYQLMLHDLRLDRARGAR